MAKKKQTLFHSPAVAPLIKEVDIFRNLDIIAELARRRAYGNEDKGAKSNAVVTQGPRL